MVQPETGSLPRENLPSLLPSLQQGSSLLTPLLFTINVRTVTSSRVSDPTV